MPDITPKPIYKKWWFFVLSGFVLLAIIGSLAPKSPKKALEAKTAVDTSHPVTAASVDSKPIADVNTKGIGISRAAMEKDFDGDEVGFTFEKGADSKGQESYMAQSKRITGGAIQLIGPADDLSEASITGIFDKDEAQTKVLLMAISLFAARVDSTSNNWIADQYSHLDVSNDHTETKVIGRRRFQLHFTKISDMPMMTLTITRK